MTAGAHPVLTHRDGRVCIWLAEVGWFVPLDAGGEGYACDHPEHGAMEATVVAQVLGEVARVWSLEGPDDDYSAAHGGWLLRQLRKIRVARLTRAGAGERDEADLTPEESEAAFAYFRGGPKGEAAWPVVEASVERRVGVWADRMAQAWHDGHLEGVAMQHLIETGQPGADEHAVNPYGVPSSLAGEYAPPDACRDCGHPVHDESECEAVVGYDHLNGDHECGCPGEVER